MPMAAPRPCSKPGCRALTRGGSSRCDSHSGELTRSGSRDPLYSSRRWRAARACYLVKHPVCPCGQAATHVDHHVPIALAPHLTWDSSNWRALCHGCHSRKTAAADGGYGNARAN